MHFWVYGSIEITLTKTGLYIFFGNPRDFQIYCYLRKTYYTEWIDMISFLWLCSHCESLITLSALIGFSCSVDLHMSCKALLWKKDLPHWVHGYGFSTVCILIWVIRWNSYEKKNNTLTALKCLFSSVCFYMNYNIFLWKIFITVTAMIWFLPRAHTFVKGENISIWKRFNTLITMNWFLSCVCLHMCCKMRYHWESLITLSALIWYFSRVYLHMTYKTTVVLRKTCIS